jgi:uncharacterized protein YcbK (DUF882 family)
MTSEYKALLEEAGVLGRGFAYSEIVSVKALHRKLRPPRSMQGSMIPTLQFANVLRDRMVEEGARGLRVAAAYRPIGGAKGSQHRKNRALDLDLLPGNYDLTAVYYEVAVRTWQEWVAQGHETGLGLYCPEGARGGIRVHVDIGYRTRTWQLWRGKYVQPALATTMARRA